MKVYLCHNSSSVKIKWNLPFLPRIGETLSVSDLFRKIKIMSFAGIEIILPLHISHGFHHGGKTSHSLK